ncbi:TerD family protein [Streptomyces sp. NPDC096080]|uniref:TerD family protein n=1 Tax=Streptomyces sp. NPDC096080 TaxID=3156693 RepID=UPI00332209CA
MAHHGSGLGKVEVRLKWDPSPLGESPRHLDIVAATYTADDPYGEPDYIVHWDSRSPDGTINMNRHSKTGMGFGFVEVMSLEFDRLAERFARVVVGVVIHQEPDPRTFGDMSNAGILIVEGYRELLVEDFTAVSGATATTLAEFLRDDTGGWRMHPMVRGSDNDPAGFMTEMGSVRHA